VKAADHLREDIVDLLILRIPGKPISDSDLMAITVPG
jgi:hypothetical protein